ncbi:RNase A-like domain-containing protein, partial [Acetonema longum]
VISFITKGEKAVVRVSKIATKADDLADAAKLADTTGDAAKAAGKTADAVQGTINTEKIKPDFKTSSNGVSEAVGKGQHVFDKHVGLSDQELLNRLNANPKITGASTFTDDLSANNVVNSVLTDPKKQAEINNWLANGAKGNLPLSYQGTTVIGRGVTRGSTNIENMTNAKIILKSNGNGGYDILTAYTTR